MTYPNPENPDEPDTLEPKNDVAQTPVQKPEIGTTLTGNKKAKELVAFETAYRLNGYKKGDDLSKTTMTKVAEHKDLKDEGQTVKIKDGPVVSPPPKTGDNTMLWIWGILFTGAFGAAMTLAVKETIRRHKERQEDLAMFA